MTNIPVNMLPIIDPAIKQNMETDVRENLNLANYNFNQIGIIDEESNENDMDRANHAVMGGTKNEFNKAIKNIHNTTTGFYPAS